MNLLIALFEGLTRIGPDHRPHPALAECIHLSQDKQTYTFTLRKVYWNDGHPLTAEDFLYAWQKVLDPQFPSPFAYKLYVIENAEAIKKGSKPISTLGVKVLDAHTLEVRLKHPTSYFLELTAFPTFFPIPRHIAEKKTEWAEETPIVSNGPFRLKQWDSEHQIILEKNVQYWDENKVRLQYLHFSMIDDTTTEYYLFEQGKLDWAGSPLSNLPVDMISELQKEGKLISYPVLALYFYKINTTCYPCNNINIRKALAHAINRKQIVTHILQAGQIPATALIPPMAGWQSGSYFEDGNRETAQDYFAKGLTELGIEKENFPTLVLSYNSNREHQKIAQTIQQDWQDVLGIQTELQNFDWKSYLSKLNRMDYQLARSGWIGEFSDPVSFLNPYRQKEVSGEGGCNETGWEHPLYQALLRTASYETNSNYRFFLLKQAEEIFIDEMPIIPLYYIVYSYVKKPHVKDVYLSPLGIADFKWAWRSLDE